MVVKTIKSVTDIKDLSRGLQDSALDDYHGNYRFQQQTVSRFLCSTLNVHSM